MSTTATRENLERRITTLESAAEKIDRLEKENNEAQKELELLRLSNKAFEARAIKSLEEIEHLRAELAKAQDHPFLRALNDLVEERIKKWAPAVTMSVPADGEVKQSLTLDHVTTEITVKEEHRDLPQESTLTTRGKIIALIAEGRLDAKKRQAEISTMLPEGLHKLAVMGELNKLVEEDILVKVKEDATHVAFVKHPDVTAKVSR